MSDHEVSALTITRYVTATTEAVYAGTIVWCLEQVAQIACSCHSMARDLAMLASLYTFTLTMRAASQECCMTVRNMQSGCTWGSIAMLNRPKKSCQPRQRFCPRLLFIAPQNLQAFTTAAEAIRAVKCTKATDGINPASQICDTPKKV